MKGRSVARPDNMSGDKGAGGPRGSRQAPLLVAPGEDLGDSAVIAFEIVRYLDDSL